ncbi:MAG: putative transposase [Yoonia sp.]
MCLQKDRDEFMAFSGFLAQHWQSIRTAIQLNSAWQCAEQNWRKLDCFDYLTKVITGVKLKDGIEITQNDQIAAHGLRSWQYRGHVPSYPWPHWGSV